MIRVCRGLLRWHLCLPTAPAASPWVQSLLPSGRCEGLRVHLASTWLPELRGCR